MSHFLILFTIRYSFFVGVWEAGGGGVDVYPQCVYSTLMPGRGSGTERSKGVHSFAERYDFCNL